MPPGEIVRPANKKNCIRSLLPKHPEELNQFFQKQLKAYQIREMEL